MQGSKWIAGLLAAGALVVSAGVVVAGLAPDAEGHAVRYDPIATIADAPSATTPAPPAAPADCGSVTTTQGVTTSAAPGAFGDGFRISARRTVTCVGVTGCWVRVELPPDAPDIYAPDRQHWVPAAATDRGCAVG